MVSLADARRVIAAEPRASGFGNTTFYGLNAFRFTNAAGKTTSVRWILKSMQLFEAAGAAPPDKNYLFDDLITQIHRQALRWRLIVIVGKPGDPTNDPQHRLAGGPRAGGCWHVDARSSRGGGIERRHGHHIRPADVAAGYGAFRRSGAPHSFVSL